jgi:hypothetical protein
VRALVACEFSGVVRRALRSRGIDAWSCDLLPAEDDDQHHIQDDVLRHLNDGWHLMIAHPPCTFLCNSGVRWLYKGGRGRVIDVKRWADMVRAADFYKLLADAPVPLKALENPIFHPYAVEIIGHDHDQIVQPWWFGHREMKATGFRLMGLPPLTKTNDVGPPPKDPVERRKWARVHQASPGADRWKERSRFLSGMADAIADQWGMAMSMRLAA